MSHNILFTNIFLKSYISKVIIFTIETKISQLLLPYVNLLYMYKLSFLQDEEKIWY